MRVFIMEGNPIRASEFMKALGGYGHTVCLCQRVSEAIRRYPLATEPYDVLLLERDFAKPIGLDGDNSVLAGEDFTGTLKELPRSTEPRERPLAIVVDKQSGGTSKMLGHLYDKGYRASWIPYGIALIVQLENMAHQRSTKH